MIPRSFLTGFLILGTLACEGRALAGVVVESMTRSSEAGASGIKTGDVLLSWSRGASGGAITSPFDLLTIEIEQAPLGPVTIDGVRGTEKHSWRLGPEAWEVKTRPNFSPAELKALLHAREFLRQGRTSESRSIWRSIVSSTGPRSWTYSWCAWDAAERMAGKRDWGGVNVFYREAVASADPDSPTKVLLLRAWSLALEESGDWKQVEEHLQASLRQAEKLGNETLLVAAVLNDSGLVSDWHRDLPTATQSFSRALVVQKNVAPASLVTAHSLLNLVMVSLASANEKEAQEYLDEAKPLLAGFPSGPDAASLEAWLGSMAASRGDLAAAREHMTQAQHILEPRWEGTVLFARVIYGQSYISVVQGDLVTAEPLLRRAAAIYDAKPSDPSLGLYLANGMGLIAHQRGDLEMAAEYTRKADRVLEGLAPLSIEHAGCLMNLGIYALEGGDLAAADEYWSRSLAVVEKVVPNTVEHAQLLGAMEELAMQRGKFDKAREYASSSYEMLTRLRNQGPVMIAALRELALLSSHDGALEEAKDYYHRALQLAEKIYPGSWEQAELLAGMADLLQQKGEHTLALEQYRIAVDALEGQMAKLGGGEAERSGFRAQHEVIYERYVDILIQQGNVEEAFSVAERSRARTLVELLTEGKIHVRQHVKASLLDQEQVLQRQFASLSDQRLRLLTEPHTDGQLEPINTRIESVLKQFADLESQVRESSPEYAALTQPQVTTTKDVQEKLLDSDTILLEYSLGEMRSYLWSISSNSVSVRKLAGRAQIEDLARRTYRNISEPAAGTSRNSDSVALAELILGPVAAQLGNKRLLIVADGALNYIPFAALPLPGGKPEILVTRHEVVNLPSASVLMTLRQSSKGRPVPPHSLAVLADPVFSAHDPRVTHLPGDPSHSKDEEPSTDSYGVSRSIELTESRWARDLSDRSGTTLMFPRLTYSRREAEAIVTTFANGQSLEALDFEASRSEAMSPKLSQYRILHFATHGVLDTKHPEFSGLLFSLVDKHGAPQIGLLSLQDIYNLDLSADMVVLSACDTALGKEVNGEGIIGLTRGFMYAGASRVVASLWKVNDVATARLMEDFYRAMERDQLSPAGALQRAQLQIRKDKKWSAPYYWAGFQLQGEWK
jgi:CHAT domain-containing protein/tetratricopeptide (TPR) repeat protein